jgi:hypothetical protein
MKFSFLNRLMLIALAGAFLGCLSGLADENKIVPSETTIWFAAPAGNFTESSPLGNGRLGAMMFGGVDDERIVLNESSVWSGSRQDADRPAAYEVLPEIQKLLLEGKNPEAEALVNANFTCKGADASQHSLLRVHTQSGACRVLCFSPRHDLTLAQMTVAELGGKWRWVQLFDT